MKYRPEIDGLRALAVLAVIFCHTGLGLFSGGFVGVDVFFVISGYLITLIIHGELQQEKFSIVQFYERRIRRILPALFFVILACIPFAWMWMMPDEFEAFSKSIVKVNLFISNVYFWKESNYFSPDAQLAPMLHTWSLAVEEQFYVLFPLILILFHKCKLRVLLSIISTMLIVSLAFSEWSSKIFPVANYYLLPTRSWELGVGSIIALSMNQWKNTNGSVAQLLSLIGLLLILFSVLTFDEGTPFPGLWALFPVIGAALIIVYAKQNTLVGQFLSWKPMVGIGLISYSAYLWHHPLFAFARIRLQGDVQPEVYLGLSVLTLILAFFTWKFVEQPFRNKMTFTRKQVFIGALLISVVFIVFGKVGRLSGGLPDRFSLEIREMIGGAKDTNPRRGECHAQNKKFITPNNSCVYGDEAFPTFAILGDSHAMALAHQLSKSLVQNGYGLRELTFSACPPITDFVLLHKSDGCYRYNSQIPNYLSLHKEIETVILTARWTLHFEGTRFNNFEGGLEASRIADTKLTPERASEVGDLYRLTVQKLLEDGKRVVLIYPVPEVGWHVPYYLAKKLLFEGEHSDTLSTSFEVFKQRTEFTHKQLASVGEHHNLMEVRPENIFCDNHVQGRCVAQFDGELLYFDDNHLSSVGANVLSEYIVKLMKEKGWL